MRQRALLSFVRQHLPVEFRLVQAGGYATVFPGLTPAEKACLYAYPTDHHFASLNRALHQSQGAVIPPPGQAIGTAMRKLVPHVGTVHRAAWLSGAQLQAYRQLAALGGTMT